MKHFLISLIVLVMLVLPFQTVTEASNVDINDYKEYDSFMKRYHEHTTELSYFIGTSYQSNEHYFKENFDLFRSAINNVYDTNKNEFVTKYLDTAEELFAKPVALLGVSNDIRKTLWDKITDYFSKDEYADFTTSSNILYPPEGYYFKLTDVYEHINITHISVERVDSSCGTIRARIHGNSTDALIGTIHTKAVCSNYLFHDDADFYIRAYDNPSLSDINVIIRYMNIRDGYNAKLILVRKSDGVITDATIRVPNANVSNVTNNIVNNYNTDDLPKELVDYTPQVKPLLVCPSEKIPLNFNEGVFSTLENVVVSIAGDETARLNNQDCTLDFEFPQIYYSDNTNKLIIDGIDYSPSTSGEIVPVDNSLIAYIRNGYDYATSVINTGVNGLKSIVNGTSGLIAFTGSIFGFLPPEIMTLFVSGFAIALGLWVFKR